MTPAQVAAPVQLEALPVAVRGADGEPVARQEVGSPRAAPRQRLRLVQLSALRSSRRGHVAPARARRPADHSPDSRERMRSESEERAARYECLLESEYRRDEFSVCACVCVILGIQISKVTPNGAQ